MSQHFGQKIFTVAWRGTSLVPMGRHGCPLHSTRGQRPNSQFLNFSNIAAIPRLVKMYRTWISPYSISAALSTSSCCSSVRISLFGESASRMRSSA